MLTLTSLVIRELDGGNGMASKKLWRGGRGGGGRERGGEREGGEREGG